MKVLSIVVVVAALGAFAPQATFAQQTIGRNGHEVDGNGAAGNKANKYVPDGPGDTFISLGYPLSYQKWRLRSFIAQCQAGVIDAAWCLSRGYPTRAD